MSKSDAGDLHQNDHGDDGRKVPMAMEMALMTLVTTGKVSKHYLDIRDDDDHHTMSFNVQWQWLSMATMMPSRITSVVMMLTVLGGS